MFAASIVGGAVLGALVVAPTPRLTYRLSVAAGTAPRSGCGDCAEPFPPGLSGWLQFGVRCPGCPARLGPRTGPVLLAGAAAFGLLSAALWPDPVLPVFLAVAAVGVLLAFIDLACLRLPDPLVGLALAFGVIGLGLVAVTTGDPDRLFGAGLAAAVSSAVYVVLALLPGSRLGFGDVKLAGVLGLMLGWFGWDAVLLGLILPHLINGPVVVALLLAGRAKRQTALPLGPALLVGALLAVLLVGPAQH